MAARSSLLRVAGSLAGPLLGLCLVLAPVEQAAQAADPGALPPSRRGSGLPIPRFASLRSDEVNVRTGPGTRYPVDWVFKRKGMPIEIVAEYENWRDRKSTRLNSSHT